MGFFDKIFGTKTTPAKTVAEPRFVDKPLHMDEAPQVDLYTALTMHLRGEVDQALSAYQKIAEDHPEFNLASFFAAAAMTDKGNVAEAAERLRSLSSHIAESGAAMSRAIAQDLFTLFNDEPLIRVPAVAELIVSCGARLKEEGFLRESAVCFEIAVGLLPEHASILHQFGDLLHDLGYFDYAGSVLQAALKHAPNHWGALYTYAVLLQDLGRFGEAIPFYERALKLDPNHAKCRNNYGAALMMTNRLEEALEQCIQAAELDPDLSTVKINLGNIYLLMHEHETARQCFNEAIAMDANIAMAYYGLASVEKSVGSDSGLIRELYLKAIELAPEVPLFRHTLGNFLADEGNPEALEQFTKAASLNNDMANLHTDFGIACLKLDRRKDGLEHLRTALKQNPNDARAREILGKAQGGDFAFKKNRK